MDFGVVGSSFDTTCNVQQKEIQKIMVNKKHNLKNKLQLFTFVFP
jgi:hypothetical protein